MRKILLLSIVIAIYSSSAKAQLFESVVGVGMGSPFNRASDCTDMVRDQEGNFYVTGSIKGTATIAGVPLQSATLNWEVFVAKLDVMGNLLWLQKASYSGGSLCVSQSQAAVSKWIVSRRIRLDAAGNVYIAGHFPGTMLFAGSAITLTSSGCTDAFLAKYDNSGNLLWAESGGSTQIERDIGLSVDGTGNAYLSGTFRGETATFGSYTIANYGTWTLTPDIFLVKYSPTGDAQWAQVIGGNRFDYGTSSVIGPDGNCHLTGSFTNICTFGSGSYTQVITAIPGAPYYPVSIDVPDAFIATFAPTGNLVRVIRTGSAYPVEAGEIATDLSGNIYNIGIFATTATFGSGASAQTLTTPDEFGIPGRRYYLAKYDSAGTLQWTQKYGSHMVTHRQGYPAIALDAQGNSYLSGPYASLGTFGIGPLTQTLVPAFPTPNPSMFIIKYNPQGDLLWATQATAEKIQYSGHAIQADNFGNCYIGGDAYSSPALGAALTAPFGPTLTMPGVGGFLVKVRGDANRLSGSIYIDANGNGLQDSSETNYPNNVMLQLQNPNSSFISSTQGQYVAYADTGAWALSLPNPPLYHSISQPAMANYSGSFAAYNHIDSTRHFGLHPTPGIQDLSLSITSSSLPTYQPTSYFLNLKNIGTTPVIGQVKCLPDPLMTITGLNPPVSQISGDTLIWDANSLPYTSQDYIITASINTSAQVNDTIQIWAIALPQATDVTPANNEAVYSESVTPASPEPNTIYVDHALLTPAQVGSEHWLTYTTRFQNTDTAAATYALLVNYLSENLNYGSFEFISSSHPVKWTLSNHGRIDFRFDSINLPPATASSPSSHGFLKYRIRTKNQLLIGDEIISTSTAYIGLNQLPTLSSVTTRVEELLGTLPNQLPQSVMVYPNPSTGTISVKYIGKSTPEPVDLMVVNSLGQVVFTQSLLKGEGLVNITHLPAGLYLLKFTGQSVTTQKIIIAK